MWTMVMEFEFKVPNVVSLLPNHTRGSRIRDCVYDRISVMDDNLRDLLILKMIQ